MSKKDDKSYLNQELTPSCKPTRGRPPKKIDYELLKQLCFIQCTLKEAAGVLKVTPPTIEKHLSREFQMSWTQFFELHSAGGKMSLRRAQFRNAVDKNNTALLIFLGKNYLGQSDKKEVEQTDKQINIVYNTASKDLNELKAIDKALTKKEEKPH